jgi:hypothetical protein
MEEAIEHINIISNDLEKISKNINSGNIAHNKASLLLYVDYLRKIYKILKK